MTVDFSEKQYLRLKELEESFFKGELTYQDVCDMGWLSQDDFYCYMRKDLEKFKSKYFNKDQQKIIKWLKIEMCENKNCNCYNFYVPTSVAKGIEGAACEECKTRKQQKKLNLRIQQSFTCVNDCCNGDDLVCSICCDVESGSVGKLPCGHTFHSNCINKWLIGFQETCPYCRKDLKLNLQVKYKKNKKRTPKQVFANLKRLRGEYRRKKMERNRIYSTRKYTKDGFYYSNNRGFKYYRSSSMFPYFGYVTVTKQPRRFYNVIYYF
jgi:hypothetical protein